MANKFYLKEFETIPNIGSTAAQIWSEPSSVFQGFTISSTHAESSAFGTKTKYVCITCDQDVAYLVSNAGTAAVAATDFPLWSKTYIAFAVNAGDKLSAVLWS
jgi:hypothetical protein